MSMKFDMSQPLIGVDGKQLTIRSRFLDEKGDVKGADLRSVCMLALLDVNELDETRRDERGNFMEKIISGEEKFQKWQLAQKIKDGGIVELEDGERALIRRLVGVSLNAETVGVVWSLLDKPISEPSKESEK